MSPNDDSDVENGESNEYLCTARDSEVSDGIRRGAVVLVLLFGCSDKAELASSRCRFKALTDECSFLQSDTRSVSRRFSLRRCSFSSFSRFAMFCRAIFRSISPCSYCWTLAFNSANWVCLRSRNALCAALMSFISSVKLLSAITS